MLNMDQLIVILLYETQDHITNALFECIAASEYQNIDLRLSTIGSTHKTFHLVLSGSWNQLTRFKTRLSVVENRYAIQSIIKSVQNTPCIDHALPYDVYLSLPAHTAALYQTIQFFSRLPISLHNLSVTRYQAPITNTPLLELNILLIIPSGHSIHDYRDTILQFCDDNHFEVILESKRH